MTFQSIILYSNILGKAHVCKLRLLQLRNNTSNICLKNYYYGPMLERSMWCLYWLQSVGTIRHIEHCCQLIMTWHDMTWRDVMPWTTTLEILMICSYHTLDQYSFRHIMNKSMNSEAQCTENINSNCISFQSGKCH